MTPPPVPAPLHQGIRFLLGFYARHRLIGRGPLAGGLGLLLVDTVILLLFALVLKQALGVLLAPAHPVFAWAIAAQFLGLLLAKLLVDAVLARLLSRAVSQAVHALRLRLFAQLPLLPLDYFRRSQVVPDTAGLFSAQVGGVGDWLTFTAPKIVQNVLLAAFSMVAMAWLDGGLTLVCLLALAVTLPLPGLFARRHQRILDEARGQEAAAMALLDEAVVMQPTLRAFHLGPAWGERFAQAHAAVARTLRRVIGVQRLYEGTVMNAANFMVFVLVVAAMGLSTVRPVAIEVVGAFFVLLQYVATALSRMGALLVRTTPTEQAARGIDDFLALAGPAPSTTQPLAQRAAEAPPSPGAFPAAGAAPDFSEGLQVDGVHYAYVPGHPVLQALHLSVQPGEFVAIVGPSGAGKSSLLALLTREITAQQGQVRLDGIPLAQIPDAVFARLVATVPQDTRLFNLTVRDNIRVGRPQASDTEVEEAAQAADAHAMVQSLAQGYDTPVQAHGASLSGGQRQRIAIARALLVGPRLLLVDEATSALDIDAETAVNDALARISLGCTVVQVTHRLRAAARASRILVMEEGRIVESGTHAELVQRKGTYLRLLEKQQAVDFDGHRPRVDVALLRRLRLLAPAGDAVLEEMARSLSVERVPQDTVLFTQGSEGDKFYIVARGKLEVRRDGTQVALLDDGDCFGEIALLTSAPRNGTVATRTPCVLLTLDRQQFRAIVGRDAQFHAQIDALVAERGRAPGSRF